MENSKRQSRIKNALRSIKRIEAKTLPIHMIKKDTHEALQKNINNNDIINKLLESINFTHICNELMIKINALNDSRNTQYNYCIGGSNAWYNIFNDYYDNNYLSEYEKSAIHKNNDHKYYYFINDDSDKYIDYFCTALQKLLDELISNISDKLNENIKIILNDTNKQVHLLASFNNNNCDKLLFIDSSESRKFREKLKFRDLTHILQLSLTISDDVPLPKPSQTPKPSQSFQQFQPSQTPKQRAPRKTIAQQQQEEQEQKQETLRIRALATATRAARAEARTARESIVNKARGINGGALIYTGIISKKILLFEINFCNKHDNRYKLITTLDDLILPNHYLNIYGLFIFLKISKIKYFIPRDKYNVFKIREHIYNKLVLIKEYKTVALFDILKIYNNTFLEYKIPKDYLYDELYKLALTSNPQIEEFINDTEAIINEYFRPYINKAIFDINNEIKSLVFKDAYNIDKRGSDYSGIYVVGGDAIRRYKYDASITKDIDSKLYMPDELDINRNINNYNIINRCIYDNLFKLLSFLICSPNFFNSFPEEKLYKEFKKTSTHNYDCKVSFELKSSDENILNFKYRQTPNNLYPVDLYSLDYRCVIIFEYKYSNGKTEVYRHNYDIAFIDISLEKSQDNNYEKYAVISNNLPIASLDFLIKDLIKTYNDDTSSLLRFINGKINKDYDRFKSLTELSKQSSKIFNIDNTTKEIIYYKSSAIINNKQLDNILPYNITPEIYDKYKYYYDLFTRIYDHDTNYRVTKRIKYDYVQSLLEKKDKDIRYKAEAKAKSKSKAKKLTTIGGYKDDDNDNDKEIERYYSNYRLKKDTNEITTITDDLIDADIYINKIMTIENEIEPEKLNLLFKKLISNK